MSTGSNGEDIWQSTSDFVPIQNGEYGSITIGEEMEMEFDFAWGGYSNDPDSTGTQLRTSFVSDSVNLEGVAAMVRVLVIPQCG